MTRQVLKPKYHVEECLEEIRECLEKGWTGLGFKTVEFEEKWKEYTGHKYAHFLNSATVGLHLAVEILKKENGWKDGDEIISTPITFVSTNHAILYEHLVPRFADVDEYLCLDPEDVKRKINDNKESIEVSERIARALKPEGALNVQLRLVNGKAIPFEINTRFSSTECVRAHYGYNSIEAMLDNYLFDKEIDLSNWKKGMFMRYWNECYMTKEELPE